jgi:VWFA-related protein
MRFVLGLWVLASSLISGPLAAQQAQFRSTVNVVELSVSVRDGKRAVTGLAATDFEILDNGARQQVMSLTYEKLPIDLTLVVDTSRIFPRAVSSAIKRIREALNPQDRLAFVTVAERVHDRMPLTPVTAAGDIEFSATTGLASINDALALVLAVKPTTDRRHIAIVFTDGYDTASFASEDDVRALTGRSHTAIHFVARQGGLHNAANLPRQPITFFHQVASATGGGVQVVPATNVTSGGNWMRISPNTILLDNLFLNALNEFRSSYVLRYSLDGTPEPGWHEVTVKVTRPGNRYTVRTRNGYTY